MTRERTCAWYPCGRHTGKATEIGTACRITQRNMTTDSELCQSLVESRSRMARTIALTQRSAVALLGLPLGVSARPAPAYSQRPLSTATRLATDFKFWLNHCSPLHGLRRHHRVSIPGRGRDEPSAAARARVWPPDSRRERSSRAGSSPPSRQELANFEPRRHTRA